MTESGDELYDKWGKLIERAARFVANDFPEVEREELVQELWTFVLSTPSLNHETAGVKGILEKAATLRAWEYRKEGLHLSAQYQYRPSDVRKLLEDSFGDMTRWEGSFVPEDARSEERFDAVIMRLDVREALRRLPLQYAEAIYDKFAEGIDPKDGAGRTRLSRAVARLADVLNHYNLTPDDMRIAGHPGSRKAMTNAQGQSQMGSYDG